MENSLAEKEVYTMCNKELLFQFRDNEKTEFELAQFACYLALRSILGKKPYIRTNKQHIHARMFGYASVKQLPERLPETIEPFFNKFKTRRRMERLLLAMQEYWNILIYWPIGTHGFYVADGSKITLESLIEAAEKNKRKNIIQDLKMEKERLRKKVIVQLNKDAQLNKEQELDF
jgi:hypothetical protein